MKHVLSSLQHCLLVLCYLSIVFPVNYQRRQRVRRSFSTQLPPAVAVDTKSIIDTADFVDESLAKPTSYAGNADFIKTIVYQGQGNTKRSEIEGIANEFQNDNDGATIIIESGIETNNDRDIINADLGSKKTLSSTESNQYEDGDGYTVVLDNNGALESDTRKDDVYGVIGDKFNEMDRHFNQLLHDQSSKKVQVFLLTPRNQTAVTNADSKSTSSAQEELADNSHNASLGMEEASGAFKFDRILDNGIVKLKQVKEELRELTEEVNGETQAKPSQDNGDKRDLKAKQKHGKSLGNTTDDNIRRDKPHFNETAEASSIHGNSTRGNSTSNNNRKLRPQGSAFQSETNTEKDLLLPYLHSQDYDAKMAEEALKNIKLLKDIEIPGSGLLSQSSDGDQEDTGSRHVGVKASVSTEQRHRWRVVFETNETLKENSQSSSTSNISSQVPIEFLPQKMHLMSAGSVADDADASKPTSQISRLSSRQYSSPGQMALRKKIKPVALNDTARQVRGKKESSSIGAPRLNTDPEGSRSKKLQRLHSLNVTSVLPNPSRHTFSPSSILPSTSLPRPLLDPAKARAIVEYLNKDPLESWRYQFSTLQELGVNSSILRAGLVNTGNVDRLKGVMRRALNGEDVTLSIVGGSISAGGGLYKDQRNIEGLYYKGLVDWWKKMITPLTGSDMIVNNIAIGSIGTDYFSYCIKTHISNDSDIVLWELAANDYNRYKMMPTKGARPLERLTRIILELPNKPALIYVNFFKGIDFKNSRMSCPDFEDQGEDVIAHYYKIPSLSWRAMVCDYLVRRDPSFQLSDLFSSDEYHPSLKAHAQMALLLLLHLRHVMRAALEWALEHNGYMERFENDYVIPIPLFLGPKYPDPLCWTLITPDPLDMVHNTLEVRIVKYDGFQMEYATNFPIRFDRVACWKAVRPGAEIAFLFRVPETYGPDGSQRLNSEVAITSHTRWGGSANIWLDEQRNRPLMLWEGRPNDPGKRTQVDSIRHSVSPGIHVLHVRSLDGGFCLSAIMIDSS